jgi:hypothetical protein
MLKVSTTILGSLSLMIVSGVVHASGVRVGTHELSMQDSLSVLARSSEASPACWFGKIREAKESLQKIATAGGVLQAGENHAASIEGLVDLQNLAFRSFGSSNPRMDRLEAEYGRYGSPSRRFPNPMAYYAIATDPRNREIQLSFLDSDGVGFEIVIPECRSRKNFKQ